MNVEKYYKKMVGITILAVCCSLFWQIWTYNIASYLLDSHPEVSDGYETFRDAIICGYPIFSGILVIILAIFLYNQLRSLKNGILFCRSCERSVVAWAMIWPFYDICATSVSHMHRQASFHVFAVEGSAIGIPIIVFTFALLYHIARKVAEENQLTI